MIRCGQHVIHTLHTHSARCINLNYYPCSRPVFLCRICGNFHFSSPFFWKYLHVFVVSTIRGANCYSSNLVNGSNVRAFSYQIDFLHCHFSLHNCHLLKSFACVLPDKLAWVIMFIAGLTLWGKKPEKRLSGADFSSVIWHQSREYCFGVVVFLNSAGVSV